MTTLAGVERRYPQTPYTDLQKSLQWEWAFLQRATPDIGMSLVVEDALWDIFLPALFQWATEQILRRAITGLPFK